MTSRGMFDVTRVADDDTAIPPESRFGLSPLRGADPVSGDDFTDITGSSPLRGADGWIVVSGSYASGSSPLRGANRMAFPGEYVDAGSSPLRGANCCQTCS